MPSTQQASYKQANLPANNYYYVVCPFQVKRREEKSEEKGEKREGKKTALTKGGSWAMGKKPI